VDCTSTHVRNTSANVDCAVTHAILAEMSEDQHPSDDHQDDEEHGEDGPASTPFDNPFFLPVLLWAFAGWFGFDIVTNAQAYQDNPKFNEYGLLAMSALAIYFTWSAIKERRAEREDSSD
jgi:hypothetical protein